MEKRSILIQLIVALTMLLSLSYGVRYNWPDFQHIKYGFPLTWGVYQLSSIAGPTDLWTVNLAQLIIDIGFWSLIMVFSPYLQSFFKSKEQMS